MPGVSSLRPFLWAPGGGGECEACMGEMDVGSSGRCGQPDEAWPPRPGASLARPLPDSESRLGKATYCLGPLGLAWDVGHDRALLSCPFIISKHFNLVKI